MVLSWSKRSVSVRDRGPWFEYLSTSLVGISLTTVNRRIVAEPGAGCHWIRSCMLLYVGNILAGVGSSVAERAGLYYRRLIGQRITPAAPTGIQTQ